MAAVILCLFKRTWKNVFIEILLKALLIGITLSELVLYAIYEKTDTRGFMALGVLQFGKHETIITKALFK